MTVTKATNNNMIPTEQPTLRTAFTKTYAIGPNRYTSFQSAIQIHARRDKVWQEVDARFREKDGTLVSEGPAAEDVAGGRTAGKSCGTTGR